MRTPKAGRTGRKLIAGFCLVLSCAGGCVAKSHIYDGEALVKGRKLAVLPGVGAPGPDGQNAGVMQAGVLITELANLQRYHVTGPGHLRKELADRTQPVGPALASEAAGKLRIDLLVLPEVTDYRFTKGSTSAWFLVGSTNKTTSKYWVTVRVLIVHPDSGKLVYSGTGSADSDKGYGPAVLEATAKCTAELRKFLADAPSGRG